MKLKVLEKLMNKLLKDWKKVWMIINNWLERVGYDN
jgi:hypothetical protein